MSYFYSASERAFFSSELMSVDAMPADKVAVTDSDYEQLMNAQCAGKIIRPSAGGSPESVEQSLSMATHFGDAQYEKLSASSVEVSGNAEISGSATVGGDFQAGSIGTEGDLEVSGAATVDGNLTVNGAEFAAKSATISGTAKVGGNFTVEGAETTVKALKATSAAVSGAFSVSGETTLGNLTAGALKATATSVSVTGDESVSGTLLVSGSATVKGALNAQGGLNVTTITATGTATLNAVNASNISASGTLAVNGTTTLTGKLTANGGIKTTSIEANSLSSTSVNATTVSATGALSGASLSVGGNATITGEATFAKVTTTGLSVGSNASVSGSLVVTGTAALNGGATVATPGENPNPKSVVNVEYLEKAAGDSVPTGMIAFFALSTVPEGWLICNGASVSRTVYAKLFAAIGTKFGAGDGSTTFTLPNLDQRFLEGTTDVSKVGQYLEAGLPNITGSHWATCDGVVGSFNYSGAFYAGENVGRYDADQAGYHGMPKYAFDASRSSSVYGKSSTVQPLTVRLLACIKS